MKEFSKKSFLAMLFAMFLLGACSTAGERDPKNFADYGYRMMYVNNTEEKYIALGDAPYTYYEEMSEGFGPYQVIEATTTYLEICWVDVNTFRYSKSADELVLDTISMSISNHKNYNAGSTYSVSTKYLGD